MIVSRGLLIVLAAIAAACLVIAFISIDLRFLTVSALASLAVFGVGSGMACPQPAIRAAQVRDG
jgi:ABC-type multidrug transport system permease subunit